jgi:hypothetical protein
MISAVAPINYGNVVSGSNTLPTQCNGSYFYARFTGLLVPTVTGLYTIGVNCQDGCNLFVGNQEIVSNVTGMDTALSSLGYTESSTIFLTAGVQYPITSEWAVGVGTYYQLQLIWTLPAGGATELIPNTCLTNLSTSITGNLDSSWWNGTGALYYPGGNGTIDFANTQHANKTLDHIPDGGARVLLTGSGSMAKAATAATNLATAPSGDVLTADGAGNVQDSGTLLSSLTSTSSVTSAVAVETARAEAAEALLSPLASPTFTGTVTEANVYVTGTLKDGMGSVGTISQVLSSTGTGTLWANPSSSGSYATTVGDGSTLIYTITHNLDTEDVVVGVYNISTGELEVVGIDITGVNTLTVTFSGAPSSNSERVVVLSSGGATGGSGSVDPGLIQHVDFTSAVGSNSGSAPGYAPDSAGSNPCYITSGNTISPGTGVTTNGSGSFIDTGMCLMGRYLWTVAVKFKTTSNTVGAQYWNDPTIYGVALQADGEDFGMTVHNQYFAAWGGFQDSTDYNAVSSVVVNDGNFHTAVATCDGYNVRFYVDGVNAGIDFTSGTQTWLGMRAGITNGGSSQIQRIAPWMGRTNTIDFDGWNNNPPPTGGANYGGQSAFTFAKLECFAYPLTVTEVSALVL